MSRFLLLLLIGLAAPTISTAARIQKRLVGGNVAGYVQYPYMVSMRISSTSSHTCGGSLITPEHVATAAHCVANNVPTVVDPSERFIVSGHLSNVSGGRVTAISSILIHPEYTPSDAYRNDVAILKLATPIPFTATEQPIPIASADVGAQPCIATGWGRTQFPSMGLPSQLQTQVMNTMTRDACIEILPSETIFESTLCVGAVRGIGVCAGDSGGPLACNGELAGIASWAYLCANGFPDGFARVYSFRDWFLENTADLSPLGKMYAAEAIAARNASK